MDAAELRARMRALPEHGRDAPIFDWDHHRWQIRQDVLGGRHLDSLLAWPTLRLTMVVVGAEYLEDEYAALQRDDWHEWSAAILSPNICSDYKLSWDWSTTGTLTHQAYHLMRWQKTTHKRIIDMDGILEIGGGYGAMALVCRQLGYTGPYTILDVPEVSLIQRYYLDRVGLTDVVCVTQPPELPEPELCISCFSTSELYLWERWLPNVANYLIAFYMACDDIDNDAWFADFAATRPELRWTVEDASAGNRYRFGWTP